MRRVTFTHDFLRTMPYDKNSMTTSHLREQWEGVSLPGDHLLEKWLGGDDTAAFFETSPAADGRRTIVQLAPETDANRDVQLDRWNRVRQLRHPNLLELRDCGRAALGGDIVLYAVFELPDDTLASALRNGPLTPDETREVLDSVRDGLAYLHDHKLVIGKLDPDHVVAVGDRIKLTTDAIRPAVDPADIAEDEHALHQLTVKLIPPPAKQQPAPPPVAPLPQPTLKPAERGPAPVVPLPPPKPRLVDEPKVPYHFPKWIIIGAAALLLVIFALNVRRPSEPVTRATTTVPVPVRALNPEPVAPPVASPPAVSKPSPIPRKEMWRVIAFTYRTHDAAAKKARQINQHHPELHATVFTSRSKKDFLVSLGGPMTREDAVRVQHTARGKGLPRDLYVQNFTEP
ncbi:MAG: Sporulation domain protein [Candidatus Solibacter sp.]|nr:Sporulation domain protein [Candidatus Solibacter sp.]